MLFGKISKNTEIFWGKISKNTEMFWSEISKNTEIFLLLVFSFYMDIDISQFQPINDHPYEYFA